MMRWTEAVVEVTPISRGVVITQDFTGINSSNSRLGHTFSRRHSDLNVAMIYTHVIDRGGRVGRGLCR
jgi:hypothetical protein